MNKYYLTIILGIFAPVLANQDHLMPLREAIEQTNKERVIELVNDIDALPDEDRKELIEYAEKWARYRKTVPTIEAEIVKTGGKFFLGVGLMPILLYSIPFFRNIIKRNSELGIVAGSYAFFFLPIGAFLWNQGRKEHNTLSIEQQAHSIIQRIKDIKIREEEEES